MVDGAPEIKPSIKEQLKAFVNHGGEMPEVTLENLDVVRKALGEMRTEKGHSRLRDLDPGLVRQFIEHPEELDKVPVKTLPALRYNIAGALADRLLMRRELQADPAVLSVMQEDMGRTGSKREAHTLAPTREFQGLLEGGSPRDALKVRQPRK